MPDEQKDDQNEGNINSLIDEANDLDANRPPIEDLDDAVFGNSDDDLSTLGPPGMLDGDSLENAGLEGGDSLTLGENSVDAKRGGVFAEGSVESVLTDGEGSLSEDGSITIDGEGKKKKKKKKKKKTKEEDEQDLHVERAKSIVDDAIAEQKNLENVSLAEQGRQRARSKKKRTKKFFQMDNK